MFKSVLLPQKGRALEVNTLKGAGQHCHIHPISSNASLTRYCQLEHYLGNAGAKFSFIAVKSILSRQTLPVCVFN